MAFEKKQTFHAVIGENGAKYVTDFLPADSGRLERTLEATSELAAYQEAFGELPNLDPGIRELVILLNEIPGIRTFSSCEGHKRDKDPCATISLLFENLTAIERFTDLVQFVRGDDVAVRWLQNVGPPPALDLCLELDMSTRFGEGLPIGCELLLGRFPMDRAERGRPPGAPALRVFTKELRERAAARFPAAVSRTGTS